MKKHLPIILLTTILGLVHCKTSASYESQEQRKQALLLNTLNAAAVCLAEQIKAPDNRHRILNSTGIITANILTTAVEKLSGPKISLAIRLLGAHLGEGASLVKAVKERRLKAHLTALTKRDIAALITKTILTSLVTPRALKEFKRQADDDKDDDKKVKETIDFIKILDPARNDFSKAINRKNLAFNLKVKRAGSSELDRILTNELNLEENHINRALIRDYQQNLPTHFLPTGRAEEDEAMTLILKMREFNGAREFNENPDDISWIQIQSNKAGFLERLGLPAGQGYEVFISPVGTDSEKIDELTEADDQFFVASENHRRSCNYNEHISYYHTVKAATTLDKLNRILENELKLEGNPINRALLRILQCQIPDDIADPKYDPEEEAY
jgi:hypothetical protein